MFKQRLKVSDAEARYEQIPQSNKFFYTCRYVPRTVYEYIILNIHIDAKVNSSYIFISSTVLGLTALDFEVAQMTFDGNNIVAGGLDGNWPSSSRDGDDFLHSFFVIQCITQFL